MDRPQILQDRENTHGNWKLTAAAANDLRNALEKWNCGGLRATQMEALHMIVTKIARVLQNPNFKDHWVDIAGYAKLGEESCE